MTSEVLALRRCWCRAPSPVERQDCRPSGAVSASRFSSSSSFAWICLRSASANPPRSRKTSEVVVEVLTALQLPKRQRCLQAGGSPLTSLTDRLPLAGNSTKPRGRSPSAPRGCRSTSLQSLFAATTTWFLYRPRERATGMWLRNFAFRGLTRQLCVVDELRLVCRRAARHSARVFLTRWAGAHFASATSCLPRDETARRGS